MAEITIKNVSKVYGDGYSAVDNVSLDIADGEFVILVGPSGCGKSTLLRMIVGLEDITEGDLLIGGQRVNEKAPRDRNLSMVFQNYALYPHLTIFENIAFPLRLRGVAEDEIRKRVEESAATLDLTEHLQRKPSQLSGGQRQRVAMGRAIVRQADAFLFDEPLSNLDADLRERMRLEIATLTRDSGATTVYITHDQSEAFALADTIGVLSQGRLVQFGKPEEIYHHPASPFVARFTGLAGEIRVTVEGPVPSDAEATPEGDAGRRRMAVRPLASVPGSQAVAIETAAPSGSGLLLVRPSAVELLAPGHPDRHLDAVVLDSAYRGRGYDHALLLTDGTQLVGVHDLHRWDRGSNVAIRLTDSGCLLFPHDDAGAECDAADGTAAVDASSETTGADVSVSALALSNRTAPS